MILPLLLLPLVSFGVVAQHPQSQQLQTAESSEQCPYTLVSSKTSFTQATYVCTGTSIKFKTNHAQSLTETIERLCEKAINLLTMKICPPQTVIDDYNKHGAECESLEEKARNAHDTWVLSLEHAGNDSGRNRSGKRTQEERRSANQLGRVFAKLDKKAENSRYSLTARWKIIQKMERDCVRKREREEKQYGKEITRKLKKYLETMKQTLKRT